MSDLELERENWSACPSEWSTNVLILFDESIAAMTSLAGIDRKEAIKLAHELLARRMSDDPSSQTCWHYWSVWERIEGTAEYFENEASQKIGFRTWASISEDAQKFRPENWPNAESGEAEFFYITGAVLAQLLKIIDSSGSWQAEVANGSLLHEALAKRIIE